MKRIPIEGGEGLVYNFTTQLSEKEVEMFLGFVNDLLDMASFNCQYVRRTLEKTKNKPIFAQMLHPMLLCKVAEQESLMNICKELNIVLKEFWAVKFGGTIGES